ncbi:probable cytochrome P450 301a1, mitochondrial [Hetaerina americana]|uniref:probable cytochrome P450 301a1, mitochondrial n=1 Tax=Hetaerina americana TaxID=62018 RepID=UPI003A7F2183
MSTSLIPRCSPFKAVLATQQPFKCTGTWRCPGRRPLNTGQPSPSTAGVTETGDHSAARPFDEMPGPKPLPIIGNAGRFLPFIGEFGGMQTDEMSHYLYKEYGPIVKLTGIPGRRAMVFSYRPEDVETVFRNEGTWPFRESLHSMNYYRNVLRKDFYEGGGSVLTENGEKWAETRSKVNQPMMQPRISKRYVPPIAAVAQEFVDKMRGMRDEKEELPDNFNNELFKWSLESIAYVALDARLGCLAPTLAPGSEPQRVIDAVNVALDKLFDLEIGPPFWKIMTTPSFKKFIDALDVFLEVSVKYVQAAIDRVEERKKAGVEDGGEPSVLERLLARTDVKTASIMAQDMLFGGIDTTSYSTAITMYMLSRNQLKQEVLFGELKRLLPHKDSPFTDEILEEMKFLKAVIKESMRMMPIVSLNTRNTTKELVLCNYRVPEGIAVMMPNITYRFNDEIYPESRRFIPERWLKEMPSGDAAGSAEDFNAVSQGKRHPFAFLPFGFGPRSCVGKRFADLEMEILLAKIIRNFHVDYKYGDMKLVSKMINTVKDPMKFKLTERSD